MMIDTGANISLTNNQELEKKKVSSTDTMPTLPINNIVLIGRQDAKTSL